MKLTRLNLNKLNLYKPFGPNILQTQLPDEILHDLNQDCLDITENKKEKRDWSYQLAGKLQEEFHISLDVLKTHARWFDAVTKKYLFPHDELPEGEGKVGIVSGWYARQFSGDFNPYHYHTGCNISCVGYLKLPDDINEYWEKEDKDNNPIGGYIDFRYGTVGLNCPNNFKVKPKVGDFYMFPNWLDHQVYPFKSKYASPDKKGERRSFSLNILFDRIHRS